MAAEHLKAKEREPISGGRRYQLTEVCERLGIEQEFVVHCIRAHWVRPAAPEVVELDDEDLARLELIRELRADFGVNEEAIPVILHLLDQVYWLHGRIRTSRLRAV